ncbi:MULTISPECIES: NADH-quinone oxidoreductase subunit A [unclassified Moraxella]|uniref:NADH-quinone oxidoreductase subunit A n=1 Tax=unclassified Moraxella TaxID=2685852 RepID=UPI003AF43088
MPAFDWSAIVFILAAVGLCIFMLVVPRLLGGTSKGFQKQENFESGVVGAGTARIRLSAKFYIVAIFFVIFDLEALYLYTYAVSVKEAGWIGFFTVLIFVVELLIGLYYLLKLGALNWSPIDRKPKAPRLTQAPAGFNLADITRFNGIEELEVDPTGKIPAQLSGAMNKTTNKNTFN